MARVRDHLKFETTLFAYWLTHSVPALSAQLDGEMLPSLGDEVFRKNEMLLDPALIGVILVGIYRGAGRSGKPSVLGRIGGAGKTEGAGVAEKRVAGTVLSSTVRCRGKKNPSWRSSERTLNSETTVPASTHGLALPVDAARAGGRRIGRGVSRERGSASPVPIRLLSGPEENAEIRPCAGGRTSGACPAGAGGAGAVHRTVLRCLP